MPEVSMSEQVAQARAELVAARDMLVKARETDAPAAELEVAEMLLMEAATAYKRLMPKGRLSDVQKEAPVAKPAPAVQVAAPETVVVVPPTLQEEIAKVKAVEARKPVDDPSRLSGTEIRRRAKAASAKAAQVPAVPAVPVPPVVVEAPKVAVAKQQADRAADDARAERLSRLDDAAKQTQDAQLGAYLEPKVQELLADQVLRGEAVKSTRRWLALLREADTNCANAQPILARRFIGLLVAELQAQERALIEAQKEPPTAKKGGRSKKAA